MTVLKASLKRTTEFYAEFCQIFSWRREVVDLKLIQICYT